MAVRSSGGGGCSAGVLLLLLVVVVVVVVLALVLVLERKRQFGYSLLLQMLRNITGLRGDAKPEPPDNDAVRILPAPRPTLRATATAIPVLRIIFRVQYVGMDEMNGLAHSPHCQKRREEEKNGQWCQVGSDAGILQC